jgi:hypothetical protein
MQVLHRRPLGETWFPEVHDCTMRAFLAGRRQRSVRSPRGLA